MGVAIGVLLYLLAQSFGWLVTLDLKVHDLGMSLKTRSVESADVVLVAIDKRSMNECLESPAFPISRHLRQHAEVIRRLDSAGTRLIVLDILFDQIGAVDSTLVATFTQSVRESGKVVLAASLEKVDVLDRHSTVITETRLAAPADSLRSAAAALGIVNMPLDIDGRVRNCYYQKLFQNHRLGSLSFEAGQLYTDSTIYPMGNDWFPIDYSCHGNALVKIPYAQVLRGGGWQEKVRDKAVVIGVTDNGSMDTYRTPVAAGAARPDRKISGVEIQAIALQTLISGSVIKSVRQSVAFLAALLVISILVWMLVCWRLVFAIPCALLMMGANLVAALMSISAWSLQYLIGPLTLAMAGSVFGTLLLNYMVVRLVAAGQEETLKVIEKDMASAGVVQKNLQPVVFPESKYLDIAAMQIPCKTVGGDYYDIIQLPGGKIGFFVGDVSGKGVTGSLIMSNMQGRFRQIAPELMSPGKVLENLNTLVGEATRSPGKFVTAFYGVIDEDSMELTYANAGHNYPLLRLASGKVQTLEESRPLLGPFPDLKYTDAQIALGDGDLLCVYTDGISEAGGDEPELQFGEAGIIQRLTEDGAKPVEVIKDGILTACRNHVKEEPFDDDWTLVLVGVGQQRHENGNDSKDDSAVS